MLTKLLLLTSLTCALIVPNNAAVTRSYSVYETVESIQSQGYVVETHSVTTEDGYILQMHRIPYGRHQTSANEGPRPVVFLMHGLMSASISFIILGAEYSPAYNLADAGFDVWMGNARGNRNSRRHVSLDPDDEEEKYQFFNFSFEEIGYYDLASMIDYVLEHTGTKKLHYIGHSQGGTVFLVLASMRPEYNDKMESVHLLAGVGYMEHFPNTELSSVAALTDIIYAMALNTGLVELFPPNNSMSRSGNYHLTDYCLGNIQYKYLCELIGVRQIVNENILEDLFGGSESAGAALKQIAHYGQNIRDKLFRRWHYGTEENLEVYGSSTPPSYNLSLITSKVTMHYTVNDNLLDERDVFAMANDMPNTVVRKVARETFLHEDFVVALDAKALVTDYIITAIRETSSANEDSVIIDETVPDSGGSDGDSTIDVENVIIDRPSNASNFVLSNLLLAFMLLFRTFQ